MSLPARMSRVLALLGLLVCTGLMSTSAAAVSPDPRLFGPWIVQQTSTQENIGLAVYFSPDGNFFLIDPRTKLGLSGSWVVGRSGLLVSVYGSGYWAKLWDADIAFENDDRMLIDVKESQLSVPQRFILQRLKF